jgi:hypothetical protein
MRLHEELAVEDTGNLLLSLKKSLFEVLHNNKEWPVKY